jgi:hypothetical protein
VNPVPGEWCSPGTGAAPNGWTASLLLGLWCSVGSIRSKLEAVAMESSAKKPDQKRPDRSIECVAALVILVGALSVGGMMTINNYMGKGLLGKNALSSDK